MANVAPKRSMTTALVALGVAFVAALTISYVLLNQVFKEIPVLAAKSELVPGQPITAADLEIVNVPSSEGKAGLAPSSLTALTTNFSPSVPIFPGNIISASDLAKHLQKGDRIVAFSPSVMPPNIQAGSVVDLFTPTPTGNSSNTTVTTLATASPIATAVTVLSVAPSANGSGSSIEVEIPANEVSVVAAAVLHGQVLVAFSSPGSKPVPVPVISTPSNATTPSVG